MHTFIRQRGKNAEPSKHCKEFYGEEELWIVPSFTFVSSVGFAIGESHAY
jgi:hypothetical protein